MKNAVTIIFAMILLSLLYGCPPNDHPITKYANKTLVFDNCQDLPIVIENDTIPFKNFRKQFEYITVAFFDKECDVCKVNLFEWYKHSHNLPTSAKHAYLMVFRGTNFEQFTKLSIHKDTTLNFRAYTLIDPIGNYLIDNTHIPREIIDASMLINRDNKIILIGEPFVTEKMNKLYRKLISN